MKSYTLNELIKKGTKLSFGCWDDGSMGKPHCCYNVKYPCWEKVSLIDWIDEFIGGLCETDNKVHWTKEKLDWARNDNNEFRTSTILHNVRRRNVAVCATQMTKWVIERWEQVIKHGN